MNVNLGPPVADLDDFLEPDPEPVLRALPEAPTEAAPDRFRIGLWLLAVAALLVAAAATLWIVRDTSGGADPAPLPAAIRSPAIPAGVAGFAELYVAAYLTGTGEDLATFLPAAPSVAAMTPGAHYVPRTAVLEITELEPNYWSVVVAADVLVLQDGGYVAAGLEHFQVGVVDDGGRLVAAALPSRVAGPPPRRGAPRSLAVADTEPDAEVAALAGDFLDALLLGDRELERYVAATSQIGAVTPAQYTGLLVTSLAAYDAETVLATVEAQESGGAVLTMQYVLRISNTEGRPLVAELLPGPPSILSARSES